MAHVGRKWPNQLQRDFWIDAGPQFAIHDLWRWRGAGTLTGTLGAGWGTNQVSQPGVADLETGTVTWTWLPPPGADPLLRYHLEMSIEFLPTRHHNIFRVRLSYDGLFGPWFAAPPDVYTQDHWINNAGACFVIVPGVGGAGSSVTELEGMRWTDL